MGRSEATIRVAFIGTDKSLGSSFARAWTRADTFGKKLDLVAGRMQAFGRASTMYLTVPLVAAGAIAWKYGAQYDETMRQVQAASGATGKQMDALGDAAKAMGYDSQYSAQEAAEAMLELAKSGITPAQIKAGALATTMSLAAAGSLKLEAAATAVANALNTFGLKASQASQVANALAGGANASSASVESLQQGLAQVGAGAVNAGLSLQETVGVLSAFANRGIQGSDAGTSLKTMLARLVPQTDKAKKALDAYNLSFIDSKGRIDDITTVAAKLKERLGGLSQAERNAALQTMFGSDATRAATVLMDLGAKGLREYIAATKDKTAASRMAAAQEESDAGKSRRALAALKTAAVDIQVSIAPVVTSIASAVADLAKAFGSLSDGQKDAIVKAGMFLAVIGPASSAIGGTIKVVLKLAAAYRSLAAMAGAASAAQSLVGRAPVGKAVAAGAAKAGAGAAGLAGAAAVGGLSAGAVAAIAAATVAAVAASPFIVGKVVEATVGNTRFGDGAKKAMVTGGPKGGGVAGAGRWGAYKASQEEARRSTDAVAAAIANLGAKAATATGAQFDAIAKRMTQIRELAAAGIEFGDVNAEHTDAQLRGIRDRIQNHLGITRREADRIMASMFKDWRPQPVVMGKVNPAMAAAEARIARFRAIANRQTTFGRADVSGLLNDIGRVAQSMYNLAAAGRTAAQAVSNALARKAGGSGGGRLMARGGALTLTGPTTFTAGEAGREIAAFIPTGSASDRDRALAQLSAQLSAAGVRGRSSAVVAKPTVVHSHLYLDGQEIADYVADLQPDPAAAAAAAFSAHGRTLAMGY